MPYALRTFECEVCGGDVQRRARKGAVVRCVACNIARSVANAYAMRTKSGAFYERWAAGMARATAEAQQLVEIGREIDSIG